MTQVVKLKRTQCNYRSENTRFLLECDFSKQYSHYYRKRLEKTRPFLEVNCRSKWGLNLPLYGLAELANNCQENDVATAFSPPFSPENNPANGSFEFPKRMRRLSAGSITETPPQTSTQKPEATENLPQTEPIQSPIDGMKTPSKSSECIIIGTIFKRMKLQPDVVEELSRGDFHVKCERYLGHYTSQDDRLVLEDADESISLVGNINPKQFVTGIVVALRGSPISDCSQFMVDDVCYAEPNRTILYDDDEISQDTNRVELLPELNAKPIYLLVISGLGFHQDMSKRNALTKALQNLIDFIWGGAKFADDERSSQVARILVIGNNLLEDRLLPPEEPPGSDRDDLGLKMKQSRQVKPYVASIQAIRHMDDFFAQLSKTIDVDIMPGPSDPSSHLLPQQPFHPCMLPKSSLYATFNCTTNPHRAIYDDNVEILATSGQNIDIISKFSAISDPIEIMKHHLIWGNSAPSAPDNLYSVPYEDDDPHVIDFIPEIYIAGNQDSYRREFYNYSSTSTPSCSQQSDGRQDLPTTSAGKNNACDENGLSSSSRAIQDEPNQRGVKKSRTLLLTVPKFCETFSCVLINLVNLDTSLLPFKDIN